ncbi:ring-cleaving dioxygenase [Oleiphilus messinensis]|uniref:Ring-cleaving dioxygenase n=1 Tax=Oleiphilus messinensis TaxID=141451 RepID=A0A1Y0IFQ0_9GAMM|nr:VOC family protein [Oleiphilus messinensis]ARU59301.1 ring-cleaving dioxygenase [Oleiphilus messinensis]
MHSNTTQFPRLTHIALHVKDIEATIAFYQNYCNMQIVHDRSHGPKRIVWLAEPGRESDFIFVIMNGGDNLHLATNDYRHFGFAVASREAVDCIADAARAAGDLIWEPVDEPYPVGYYCGLKDPNGNAVEFSFGQPLGPGAQAINASVSKL